MPAFLLHHPPYLSLTPPRGHHRALPPKASTACCKLLLCSPTPIKAYGCKDHSQKHQHCCLGKEEKKKSKTKCRMISQGDAEATFRPCSSGTRSISATELEFPRPRCVLTSAVRVTRGDYCHLHCNHVVGLVLRTKTSTLSREKGGGKGGEGAREHTKEAMQSSNRHHLNFH